MCSDHQSGKNDFHYVRAALKWLIMHRMLDFKKKIVIISDNTGKHFKNCTIVEYVMYLATSLQILIFWLMYAPNHGWSLYDSHDGILSQIITKAELDGAMPDTAAKLQKLIEQSNCTATYPVVFMVFDVHTYYYIEFF